MKAKATAARSRRPQKRQGLDALYHELLHWYYDKQNIRKARLLARRLQRRLVETTSDQKTILWQAASALASECLGDLPAAIEHRKREIQLMKRLLLISSKSPEPQTILKYYDYSDLTDRLDLLAILYHDVGNLDQAFKVLRESKRICEEHRIPFDGQDVLEEYRAEANGAVRSAQRDSEKRAV